MGRSNVMLSAAALVVMMVTHGVEASWKSDGVKDINVGGKVMCQDCTKGWNHWAYGAIPLKGCKVAVTCMDARRRVVYYASDETDEGGEFDLPVVSKHMTKKEIDPRDCIVRLVSSPHATCNVMTNFGGGRSGVALRRPSHVYQGLLRYTVGPLYFTSPMCEAPDMSESGKGSGY